MGDMQRENGTSIVRPDEPWDHSSSDEFFEYYAAQSASEKVRAGAVRIRALIERVHGAKGAAAELDVLDVGCNAGTQCLVWAEGGHRVVGVDINAPLVELADRRAREAGLAVDFRVGSATELPVDSGSMDVCISLVLLEHVEAWEVCLDEFARVLRPGGVLYLTTTNRLCPVQDEFNLPLYSWYPRRLKRYYEKLSVTTRPDLVNHATYPAVHWFTYYGLRRALEARGLAAIDRFDAMDVSGASPAKRLAVGLIRAIGLVRWFAQACSVTTVVVATKRSGDIE